eukprot:6197383-Pleurochrysis_carterae.AAC.2
MLAPPARRTWIFKYTIHCANRQRGTVTQLARPKLPRRGHAFTSRFYELFFSSNLLAQQTLIAVLLHATEPGVQMLVLSHTLPG